ncbi:hydrogenase expression/formation protein HypE [Candidatus Lokiarchaeum ossiferum]|uniref:hydrogenase expression/formation protein HypE n=1 Tax=Candidatus Lokiarchaeum ossiferum TaxID=2951803 RepID=UPI00352CB77A
MEETPEKKIVQLGHGGGGIMQGELIRFITENIPIKQISNGIGVDAYDDGATIPLENYDSEIVVTADGHTVDPLIFPGGDLGKLSVCGTVNDIIMMGAKPLALTSIVLIEEGQTFEFVGKIMDSFNKTAGEAGIAILAGDTKVMPRGTLKEMVISTSGIGIKPKNLIIRDSNCQPGAKIILTGSIGDHGAALIARREGIDLQTELKSDVAMLLPLYNIIKDQEGILAMKDPTRGGLASALNEWAEKSNVSIWIKEEQIIIKKEVKAICDILGLDPLEIANEGKAIICVEAAFADHLLEKIQATPIGHDARIIAEVKEEKPGLVVMQTPLGGKRIVEKPMGELIPRIC